MLPLVHDEDCLCISGQNNAPRNPRIFTLYLNTTIFYHVYQVSGNLASSLQLPGGHIGATSCVERNNLNNIYHSFPSFF